MNRTVKSAVAMAAVAAMSLGALAACGSSTSGDDAKGKVYYLNFKPEAADQWTALAKEYTKEKGMEVQSAATPNGYLIQAAQADTLRTLSGMKLATTVELTVNGTQLNVTLGEGQWADKLGAGAVGIFLLWPLAVTAGIGAYKQKKLPSEIFEVVYRCTMGEPTSFRTAGVPVNAAPTAPAGAVCPQCGAQIFANARFCSACGAKLQTVCPGCGAPVKPGSKFCSECGQALS